MYSAGFKNMYRKNCQDFIRERCLGFESIVLAVLNKVSRSLSVELNKFLQGLKQVVVSKQAFSQARYKIKWEVFVALNDAFVGSYYEQDDYRLFKGKYLLLCSDGSDYELPWNPSLVEAFGTADNGQAKQPRCMAKGVKIWDFLNQLTVSSHLGRYDVAENQLFKVAWQQANSLLSRRASGQLLLLGDMHYPAFWLVDELNRQSNHFLFRCPVGFCREVTAFMEGPDKDAVLNIPIGGDSKRKSDFKRQTGRSRVPDSVQVRALKFELPDGKPGCLLTSVPAEELPYEEVCELYRCRWGEEISFNFDKNRAEIENFSAKMPQGIRQEWYANTLNSNYVQLFIEDAQELLDKEMKEKNTKYDYKINRSVALGIIKDELPKMLFGNEQPNRFYNRIIKLIVRCREPVRPGRTFPRERKHKLKFSMNLRRVI